MRSRTIAALISALALSSCSVDLSVPTGAELRCYKDADCPAGFACHPDFSRCVEVSNNRPPTIQIGSIAHTLGVVEIPVTLTDPEADAVTLAAAVNGATITLAEAEPLASSPQGVEHVLHWDAAAHYGDTGLRSDLQVTITPQDANNLGTPLSSDPFMFGNDAPRLSSLEVDTNDLGIAKGVIQIMLFVDDTPGDTLSLDLFDLSLSGTFADAVGITNDQFEGSVEQVPTGTLGGVLPLAWRSGEAANTVASSARIRVRLRDSFGATSELVESAPFDIDNAPSLRLEAAASLQGGRAINAADVRFFVDDPNEADTISVRFEYALVPPASSEVVWYEATPHAGSDPVAGLAALDPLTAHAFRWNALRDAELAKGLSAALVGIDTEGTTASTVSYTPQVFLRATPQDSSGLFGPTVELPQGFAIGNDPPLATLEPLLELATGAVPIAYALADSAADDADIEIEFDLRDGPSQSYGDWRKLAVLQGETRALSTRIPLDSADRGTAHVLTWNSNAPRSDDALESPQGIGATTESAVKVRLRAIDAPGVDGESHFGPWSEGTIALVRNQSPPRIEDVVARRAELVGGTSPILLSYVLVDEESDPADIRCQYSFDFGSSWSECVEFLHPLSEGTTGLATAPPEVGGRGGVRHTYTWDPSGAAAVAQSTTRLRFTATDGKNEVTPTTDVQLARPAAPIATSLNDTPFFDPVHYANSDWPIGIAVMDLNGDGILDIASASYKPSTGYIAVYLGGGQDGIGNGQFTRVANVGGGNGPFVLTGGYFDGDTKMDLAVLSLFDESLRILLGNGDGTFVVKQTVAVGFQPRGIELADFNNDGFSDLVIADGASAGMSIWLGKGDGTVEFKAGYYDTATFGAFAVADLDEDDNPDIVAIRGYDAIVLTGVGDGTFEEKEVHPLAKFLTDVTLGDFNADGAMDVALSASSPSAVIVLFGDGSAGFASSAAPYDVGESLMSITATDVNADGVLDLVCLDNTLNALLLMRGNGRPGPADGTFGAPKLVDVGPAPRAFEPGDFNHDGRADLAAVRTDFSGISAVSVVLSRPQDLPNEDSFVAEVEYGLPGLGVSLAAADFNADGAIDLVSAIGTQVYGGSASDPVGLSIALGQSLGGSGDGTFSVGPLLAPGFKAGPLACGDFSGDGLSDVAVVDRVNNELALFLTAAQPDGSVVLATPQIVSLGASGGRQKQSLVVRDFNRDGILDLAATDGLQSGNVLVFLGESEDGVATGTFASSSLSAGAFPSLIAAGDFDGDGILDLVVSNGCMMPNCMMGMERPALTVLLGHGTDGAPDGNFTPQASINLTTVWQELSLLTSADLNLDGLDDLVFTGGSGIYVMLATDTGFGTATSYTGAGTDYSRLLVMDATNDGILDIVASTSTGVDIFAGTFTAGLPTGTFSAAVGIPLVDDGLAMVAQDLNGDTLVDVVLTSARRKGLVTAFKQADGFRPYGTHAVAVDATVQPDGFQLFGVTPDPTDVDLFGNSHDPRLYVSRVRETMPSTPLDESFAPTLKQAAVELPSGLLPLTHRYWIGGAQRITRVVVAQPDGHAAQRLRVESRLGRRVAASSTSDFDRHPLDLSSTDIAAQSGIIVEIPILDGRSDGEITGATERRLYIGVQEWKRASSFPDDPLFIGDAGRYLPCRVDETNACAGDLWMPTVSWVEAVETTDPTFMTGSGRRFFVDLSDPEDRMLRVLTDRLGTLEAYLVP